MKYRCRVLLVLVSLIMIAMGCSAVGWFREKQSIRLPDPKITVDLESVEHLNLDARRQPHSVVVRLYQLRDASNFNRARFRALWADEKKVLGGDLIGRREITVLPGLDDREVFDKDAEARHLGIAAGYIRPSSARSGMECIPLETQRSNSVLVRLQEDRISVGIQRKLYEDTRLYDIGGKDE